MLLTFAEALDHKPVNPDDVPAHSEPQEELRRVKRRKGRRNLANFENLPVTTHIYELHGEQRACCCCGLERDVTGRQESWQIEYYPGHFERLHHVRLTYACKKCEQAGENPQMETAAKPASAIEKGLAAPGLLSYIVTSKFAVYVPLYRLEDIFARQGFEISRATQSVWCGDVADLVEPLWELMAERVRASHVVGTDDTIMPMQNPGKTANARMWVYVGDDDHPDTVFDFTLNRGRDGPKYFLRDYNQVLLADAYGGYNGVVAGARAFGRMMRSLRLDRGMTQAECALRLQTSRSHVSRLESGRFRPSFSMLLRAARVFAVDRVILRIRISRTTPSKA